MRLNVLYEFSDLYSPYAGISIYSLLENNKKLENIYIYVLDDGVSEENKHKIKKMVNNFERKIHFINTSAIEEMLVEYNVPKYKGSYSTYYKLFAMNYLPQDIESILYLDSDTIVTGDLSELAAMDLNDAPCAMVLDPIFDKYKEILGIGREAEYFNCGMGMFNVKVWENKCEKEILNLLKYKQSGFFIMDQDIINLLYNKEIIKLPLKYNLTGAFVLYNSKEIYRLYDYKRSTMYSPKEIDEAKKSPCICHYIAYQAGRPWESDNIHPMTPLFDYYLAKTPWKNLEKVKGNYPITIKIQRLLYKYLPRTIYIPIHKLILGLTMSRMAKKAERKV